MFGGSISFSVFNVNPDGPSYNSSGNVGVFPSYLWVIKKNLALGVRGNMGYNRSVTKFDNGDKGINTSTIAGVSVFLKKYKFLKEKFGLYFENELGGNYNAYKNKSPLNADYLKSSFYGMTYRFSPGMFYKFSKHFIGEGNIGGVYTSYYGGHGTHNFGAGVSFLQFFNLGINYVIEKKKQG